MSDSARGVYRKFKIERTDGSSAPGGKHEDCTYFVLDLAHDKFAIPALRAYADACALEFPDLAYDLRRVCDDPFPRREMQDRMDESAEGRRA